MTFYFTRLASQPPALEIFTCFNFEIWSFMEQFSAIAASWNCPQLWEEYIIWVKQTSYCFLTWFSSNHLIISFSLRSRTKLEKVCSISKFYLNFKPSTKSIFCHQEFNCCVLSSNSVFIKKKQHIKKIISAKCLANKQKR